MQTHKELGERTKTGLAQATARAAEAAAKDAANDNPLPVKSTAHLRDLAGAASQLFDWNSDKKPPGDTYNTLVITQEQLEQIRQLRE